MSLLLNVPYSQKDQVKKLGAWWNPDLKTWYIRKRVDYPKFRQWISTESEFIIICNHLYLIEGVRTCFRCNSKTPVIAFGIDTYYEFADPEDLNNGYEFYDGRRISIIPHLNPIPEPLAIYLKKHYNYKTRYSKTTQNSYWANCCTNCDVLQGDFYLYYEPDSPFFVMNERSAAELTLYKIPLKYDIVVTNGEIIRSSSDILITQYARKVDLNIL